MSRRSRHSGRNDRRRRMAIAEACRDVLNATTRRETTAGLVRSRTTPTPDHTIVNKCFMCKRDVYNTPEGESLSRRTTSFRLHVCDTCIEKESTFVEFNRRLRARA